MQLRYLRHYYDVVYDYWIAAVRKSAVWILLRLNTLDSSGCVGRDAAIERYWRARILEGCSHRKNTSVSLVRIRFDAIFADIDTRWIIHSNHPTVIGFVCLQYIVFLKF